MANLGGGVDKRQRLRGQTIVHNWERMSRDQSDNLYEFQAIYLFSNLTIRIQFSADIQETLIEETIMFKTLIIKKSNLLIFLHNTIQLRTKMGYVWTPYANIGISHIMLVY